MISEHKLFSQLDQSEQLDHRLRNAEARITGASAEDLDGGLAEVVATPLEPLRLLRDRASFQSEAAGTNVRVEVTIPFAGDPSLLTWKPPGGTNLNIVGRFSNNGSFDAESERQKLTISKLFDATQQDAEIREWAKRAVDAIEIQLRAQEPFISEFNRALENGIGMWTGRRRAALQAVDRLGENLGGGI